MANFNWRTDDEVVWDDEAAAEEKTAVTSRRPWLIFIIIGLALFLIGFLMVRQVNQHVETSVTNATNDMLSSHNLVQQAGRQNDVDLFRTMLSGLNQPWARMQTEGVTEGWLHDRAALGLRWLPAAMAVTLADVEAGANGIELEIDPKLNAAELRFPQEYAIEVGNGVTETVILQQTAVYRRGSERWLLSPPDDDFWGEYTSNQGSILTLAYPERDKIIAEKLAFDLEAKLDEMCRTLPSLDCPDGLRVHVRLSNELNSLSRGTELASFLENGMQLELPAPTLVGLPVDEAGYQALYRGYAAGVITAVIPQLVGYECCQHALFFQALIDYQLSQLGVRPWPVTEAEYDRIIREGVSFNELNQVWQGGDSDNPASANKNSPNSNSANKNSADDWKAYVAVDFLMQRFPETAVADMQRLMPNRLNLATWLLRLYDAGVTLSENPEFLQTFTQEWQTYALQQSLADQGPPPIPWLEQDLYLVCVESEEYFPANIRRLDVQNMAWTAVLSDTTASFVNPLPQKDGLVIQSLGFEDNTAATTIWRPEGDPLVMTSGHTSLGQLAPDGRLIAYGMNQEESGPILIDMTDCPDGVCPLFPLTGLPVWSPGQADFILLPDDALAQNPFRVNGRIYLFDQEQYPQEWPLYRGGTASVTGDVDEMIALGSGYAPFWVDDMTYGYVRQVISPSNTGSGSYELLLASTTDDQPRVLLTEADLMAALPEEERPLNNDLSIRIVTHHLTRPGQLFILAFDLSQTAYVFSYDMTEETIMFHFQMEMVYFHSLGVSPNGRFLIIAGADLGIGVDVTNQIRLYDLSRQQSELFVDNDSSISFAPANIYDWSADGQWLALILDEHNLLLIAPEYDYQQLISHDLGQCINVIWLNQ